MKRHPAKRGNEAVSYVRVSDARQVANASIPTQVATNAAWIRTNGYGAGPVFRDEGVSAKTIDRGGLEDLLAYCTLHADRIAVVVVFVVSRLSRDTADYFYLRSMLKRLDIAIRSSTEPFDESPFGEYIETQMVSAATLDNRLKSQLTKLRMRGAIEQGRYLWVAPLGYQHGVDAQGRKNLTHDPERAPLMAEGFRLLATGHYGVQEVLRRLEDAGLRTRKGNRVPYSTWASTLRRPVYCGRIVVPEWAIDVQGAFVPIVDEVTWRRVQVKAFGAKGLESVRRVPSVTAADSPDFPFRRFAHCARCDGGLTGGWSTTPYGRYAYYRCHRGECRAVSVRAERLQERFVSHLRAVAPPAGLWDGVTKAAEVVYRERSGAGAAARERAEGRLAKLKGQLEHVERAYLREQSIDADTYRKHRADLQREISETVASMPPAVAGPSLPDVLAAARDLMTRPADAWLSLSGEHRARLQVLLFPDGLKVNAVGEVATRGSSSLFSSLAAVCGESSMLVPPDGFALNALTVRLADLMESARGWFALQGSAPCAEPLYSP